MQHACPVAFDFLLAPLLSPPPSVSSRTATDSAELLYSKYTTPRYHTYTLIPTPCPSSRLTCLALFAMLARSAQPNQCSLQLPSAGRYLVPYHIHPEAYCASRAVRLWWPRDSYCCRHRHCQTGGDGHSTRRACCQLHRQCSELRRHGIQGDGCEWGHAQRTEQRHGQ